MEELIIEIEELEDFLIDITLGSIITSEIHLQEKTITPTISKQIIEPDVQYGGLSKVTVNAVTSTIDSDIQAKNIRKGINILGVSGTLEEGIKPTGTLDVTENGEYDVTNYEKANVNVESGADFEITNCNSLFYTGARLDVLQDLLQLVKKPTTANMMFTGCTSMVDLDMSHIDGSELIMLGTMFASCMALTNFKFMKNLGKGYTQKTSGYYAYGVSLTDAKNLTHDSLMDIINNLYDLNLTYKALGSSATYTQKLQIGTTNITKLTAEEIAIATKKGWSVS